MRLDSIKAKGIKPVEVFEVSALSELVVLAGPNGVGKTRLIQAIISHFRSVSPGNISFGISATNNEELKAWGKKSIDTANPGDGQLLRHTLQRKQKRHNTKSSVLVFESNRSIQRIQPYSFTWDIVDPWDEDIGWDFNFGGLSGRFQDTLHAIFRKIQNQESEIAKRAKALKDAGKNEMPLDFPDPLEPFRAAFIQLLGPKQLVEANVRSQTLTYSDNGVTHSIEALSSGEREVLNTTFDFILRSPSDCIVFFDEPELHLHPELSYKLLNTLKTIGRNNQFILCTHSPDIISASLDNSVIFVSPQKVPGANQAILIKEDDASNQALRILGHSVGIVALGKKLVLIEGQHGSLDKMTYGSILKSRFPGFVLVPSGSKGTITSFQHIMESVLEKSMWGVDFFMICDRDAAPFGIDEVELSKNSKGRLKILRRYHLENYFLEETVISKCFEEMEPSDSWLRDPQRIRTELRQIAQKLVPYAVALNASKYFRLGVGNVDLMPKDVYGSDKSTLVANFTQKAQAELTRVSKTIDSQVVQAWIEKQFDALTGVIDRDDDAWKELIPGKIILSQFASKAKMDQNRLKTLFILNAEKEKSSPFSEIIQFFEDFKNI